MERDPERKRRQLTFVIIGGGLVGVELFGELTAFADGIARFISTSIGATFGSSCCKRRIA